MCGFVCFVFVYISRMRATIRQMQQVLHHKSLSASASNTVPAVTDYEGEQCEEADRRTV